MLKKRGRQGDLELVKLLQDKGLDPNFATMFKEKSLDPTILSLLQRSGLDADRDHRDNTDITIADSNRVNNALPNHISLSEELRPVLHHVAWVLFCFVFILKTIAERPKIFKIIKATQRPINRIAVLLLQAEEMAMNFKPRQGLSSSVCSRCIAHLEPGENHGLKHAGLQLLFLNSVFPPLCIFTSIPN